MKFLYHISLLFFCFFTLNLNSQVIYPSPNISTNSNCVVIYKDKLFLPTAKDIPVTRNLKVEIVNSTNSNITTGNVHVWIRKNFYTTVYHSVLSKDSTFEYTSDVFGIFVQFIFTKFDSASVNNDFRNVNEIFGHSNTISIPYGREDSTLNTTSVVVPSTEIFRIVPNPVINSNFIDIHLPSDINGFNPNTRFRITRMDGVLVIDVPYINLEQDEKTIQTFQSLNNGNYIAQVYNVPMGINRIFPFVVAK